MFNGILVSKDGDNQTAALTQLDEQALPDGDVTIAVEYSSLNYKDALAITGRGRIVQRFPMVPGIDLAGAVLNGADERFSKGQRVLVNGWGLGEDHWGGLAQRACVNADWLTPLPEPLTTHHAMALGTAGFTAMLCVQALERQGVTPEQGDIVVTGATGGVGSIAVYLLAKRGFRVAASTGRPHEQDYLQRLGAAEIIDRDSLTKPGRPLQKQRWAGAVDVAGGHTLANLCASMRYRGVVAACGLAEAMELPATVAPFILRGVRLIGINSVYCPHDERHQAWQKLAEDWNAAAFADAIETIDLADVIPKATALLEGGVRGRVVVKL